MRRKRKKIPWPLLLWAAVALNVALGTQFSKATSLKVVRVSGADASVQGYLREVLSTFRGEPALRISRNRVESMGIAASSIASVEFVANVFGRGTLTVQMRIPVGAIEGKPRTYLDETGVIFKTHENHENLAIVRLPKEALEPQAAAFGSWPCESVAALIKSLKKLNISDGTAIDTAPTGEVSFQLATGLVVRLGQLTRLEEKMSKFDELRRTQPGLLERSAQLILVEPGRPSYVPRRGEQ